METINNVLNFLNQMEMFDILSVAEYKTIDIIRKIFIDEFVGIDLDKLVETLKTLGDDFFIEYLRVKLYFDRSLVTKLRNKIFDMYNQKMTKRDDNA